MKRDDEAIKCYDKIVDVYRKTPYTSRILCNEAIESYDTAIQKNLNNNNIELLYNKGLFLLHTYASRDECINHAIEPMKCYDKIIEINPNHAKAWIKKGLIHEGWGCWDKPSSATTRPLKSIQIIKITQQMYGFSFVILLRINQIGDVVWMDEPMVS